MKLTDDQLKAIVDQELRQSIGYGSGKLSAQRQKALVYYEALPKLDLSPPEIEGRSSVVSPDVRNIIQSVLPVLMAKFASSEDVCEAVAKRMDKEAGAKQVTDYLNHLFYDQCSGHEVLETAFLDTLISKVGIVKVWWDERVEETAEVYKGLDDLELGELADDDEIEIVTHTAYPDEEDQEKREQAIEQLTQQAQQLQAQMATNPQAGQQLQQITAQIQSIQSTPPRMLHDVDCKRSKDGGKINMVNVPPEEFRISRKAKTVEDAPFVAHSVRRTLSELKSLGYKNVDQISSDPSAQIYSAESVERQSFDDEQPYYVEDTTSIDDSMRVVWVNECYMRADRDGDGIAELLKITKAGNTLLDCEVVDVAPFVDFRAITTPYRFFGASLADFAMESQRIKTAILRATLDNLMIQVNGRYFAVEGQVNLDDLLASRPGGVVRIKNQGSVGRLDQSAGDAGFAMQMLEYLQGFTEESTGWQRQASQVDNPDTLNNTATASNIQQNRAQMRVDMMARNLSAGLVKLFRMMLKLVCQHQDKVQEVKIGEDWQQISPREWANAYDFRLNVGLGTGTKDQQVQQLNLLMQHQAQAMAIGVATPENVYQAAKKLTECMGFKNAEAFWSDPAKAPPQPPQPNPDMVKAQAQMQVETQKMQMQDQQHQREMELQARLEVMKQRAQDEQAAHQKQMEAERDAHKAQLEADTAAQKAAIDAAQKEQQMAFEKWKAELQANTQIYIEEMKIRGEVPADVEAEQSQINQVLAGLQAVIEKMNAPKMIVRDERGRAIGVQHVGAQ